MSKRVSIHRARMLTEAKRQIEEAGIEFASPNKQWADEDDTGFSQGERSDYKTQRNKVNKIKRWAAQNVRSDIAFSRRQRETDPQGRDWMPMPEGTLVEFVKNDTRFAGERFKKGALATVVKEFETDGKRWVEVLVGAQVIVVKKSALKEL